METKVILKYRRERDSWLCGECDTENSMSVEKCIVCGYRKSTSSTILKTWTEADERPVIPVRPVDRKRPMGGGTPPSGPSRPPYRPPSGSGHTDSGYTSYTDKNSVGIAWGILAIIIVIILITAAVGISEAYAQYSDAMYEYNKGNYEVAANLFEGVPFGIKDSSKMASESNYRLAKEYMSSKDFKSAESLFRSISDYGDSAEKADECKYKYGMELYNSRKYDEAITEFEAIPGYSDSDDMAKVCNYEKAIEYKNKGAYVESMKIFRGLGSYKSSKSQYNDAQQRLVDKNKNSGYYSSMDYMYGKWSDSSGNHVTYTRNENGGTNVSYNLEHTKGKYFKFSNGVHYHGDDDSGWKAQWIFQRIDNSKAKIYNFSNGKIYTLTRG